MKWPLTVRDEARDEANEYFDKNIRPLEKTPNGTVDIKATGLENNDADAFRHAYVSGVLTQEFSEKTADILGRLNEYLTLDLYSNSKDPRALNMDLWNNAVGRKYGKKAKSRGELLKLIHEALNSGELIIQLTDETEYTGARHDPINKSKPIIVLKEDDNGRNKIFFDVISSEVFTREEFVSSIKKGKYPGYTVKIINGITTPVSMPDRRKTNNLS